MTTPHTQAGGRSSHTLNITINSRGDKGSKGRKILFFWPRTGTRYIHTAPTGGRTSRIFFFFSPTKKKLCTLSRYPNTFAHTLELLLAIRRDEDILEDSELASTGSGHLASGLTMNKLSVLKIIYTFPPSTRNVTQLLFVNRQVPLLSVSNPSVPHSTVKHGLNQDTCALDIVPIYSMYPILTNQRPAHFPKAHSG